MKSPIQIIHEYIQMYESGNVKTGLRVITKEEAEEREIPLLQAIAADIEAGIK